MEGMSLILGLLVLGLLLSSHWGPGNHMEFAERIYRRRREWLPASVARLLTEERSSYLYGNIAADLINFKAFGGHYNHCHRWTIVEDMQAASQTPGEEAFCLGYLSHLAADTIAHNHFVPYHLARYSRGKSLGHVYWEMSADRFVKESRWQAIGVLKRDHKLNPLDELVNSAVPKKALPFKTNKLLFNHVLLVSERERWRRGVERLHPMRQVSLEKGFLEQFRRAAVGRIRTALHKRGLPKLVHLDTNGKAAQREAAQLRRKLILEYPNSNARREESEAASRRFLTEMKSPPSSSGDPHWA